MENKKPLAIGLHTYSLQTNSGENLPHWNCKNAVYHISFRLADSVPNKKREEWLKERVLLEDKINSYENNITEKILKEYQYLYSDRIEKYLDSGFGACYLVNGEIANLVSNALDYFEGNRYNLHAWCIMPNHVHVIVEPFETTNDNLSKIVHSWKSFVAHKANKILKRNGEFWQHDYFNHIIRSYQSYLYQVQYVWTNPDNAGIKNWPYRWKKVQ